MSASRLKLLLEMRPALDGHAGIPQETRLLFNGLVTMQDVEAIGLMLAKFEAGADVVYGVRNGSTDNYQRMAADASLINRDVRLHLIDGSAGGDLNRAVDLTIRDMFGDVQVVKAPGVKITLPTATDAEPLLRGFTGVKPKVADALRADMQNGMVQIIGGGDVGMGDIVSMGIDNAVSRVMEEGYFINAAGEHYQFFNPFTGTVVAGKDGAAMLFSKADVMAAGAKVPQLARPFPGMGGR